MIVNSFFRKIARGLQDMCYIWAHEMRNVIKDEGALIFMILVPLGYPLLYSWIYNNEVVHDVPTAIVDMSHSASSRQFIEKYDASADTKAAYYCDNMEEAKDLVAKQAVHGILYFPADYDKLLNRGEQAHVGVYTDMSLMLTYKSIYQTAQAVATNLNSKIQIAQSGGYTNRDDEITTKPLDFEDIPIYNVTGGYGNAIIPGVVMLILQQTLLLGIGLLAGTARETNKNKELVPISEHYAGVFRIVTGKSLCYFMIYAVMGAYLTTTVPRFFHYVQLANPWTLLVFMLPYVLSCIFFGMMLSCVVRYRENVMLLVVFTSVPFLFLTGVSWPLSNMPGIWQGFSWLIPSTWGIRGFLKINSMGADISEAALEYHALWLQTGIYFVASCLVYRHQLRSARRMAGLNADTSNED